MKITLIYSPAPRQVREWALDLAPGTTLSQALRISGIYEIFTELTPENMAAGIWGKRAGPNKVLQENNRIEIYRGLRVDPKVARRERFAQQGAKGTGLFAASRPGAKAGY